MPIDTTSRGGSAKLPEDLAEAAAEASSAHARINVPLNVGNWTHLPEDVQHDLTWFHQHALSHGLGWNDCVEALGYDRSTIFRVLKGTYNGSWSRVCKSIASYRKLFDKRRSLVKTEFVENSISRRIWAGLDYALVNQSMTLIVGESRLGKTEAIREWQRRNNHGRTIYIEAPPVGGYRALMELIAHQVGVNTNYNSTKLLFALYRAFNRNRMIIVDEAIRLVPTGRSSAQALETLRSIKDQTGAAVALVATARMGAELARSRYQFEQVIGRIGMPIKLPAELQPDDVAPIIKQFGKLGRTSTNALLDIANRPGRLGIMVETLKVADRIARKAKKQLSDDHVLQAIRLRREMSDEGIFQ